MIVKQRNTARKTSKSSSNNSSPLALCQTLHTFGKATLLLLLLPFKVQGAAVYCFFALFASNFDLHAVSSVKATSRWSGCWHHGAVPTTNCIRATDAATSKPNSRSARYLGGCDRGIAVRIYLWQLKLGWHAQAETTERRTAGLAVQHSCQVELNFYFNYFI